MSESEQRPIRRCVTDQPFKVLVADLGWPTGGRSKGQAAPCADTLNLDEIATIFVASIMISL